MAGNTVHGPRTALDRERLVHAALELLDEVGLDELSMRRLAERLGVTAASLYWYVQDKNELLELLADAISAEMYLPDLSRPWRTELETLVRSWRQVALAHRDVARVLVATMPTSPHRLRAIDALLGLLTHAGFSPGDAADAAYVLNVYGVGFMLDEALGPHPAETGLQRQSGPSADAAPLNPLVNGRLILEHGAANLTIRADASLPTLYQMTFEGRPPEVEARDGTVRIRQRHGRGTSCNLTLAGAITWEIHIHGGATRLAADLRALRLSSFQVSGGVNQAVVQLPQPSGTIPMRIDGDVHKVRIERPFPSAIRLHLSRGSSHITLDGSHLGAVGGGTDWESPDYATASDRYNLAIGGGANELSISAPALEPASIAGDNSKLHTQMHNWFAAQPPDTYPNLVALAAHLAEPSQDHRFEVGLQILLDGLERRLAASASSSRP